MQYVNLRLTIITASANKDTSRSISGHAKVMICTDALDGSGSLIKYTAPIKEIYQ